MLELRYTIPLLAMNLSSTPNGATTRVEILASRTEGKLFSLPQLAPGSYGLEARKGCKTPNEIRKGAHSELLILQ